MRTQKKSIKALFSLSLLVLAALLLSACGAAPVNNYAGLSTDGTNLYVAEQSFFYVVDPGTGSVTWKYPAKAEQNVTFYGAPAAGDGWVYAGSYNNVAYGFALERVDAANPTASWTFNDREGKGRFIGAPAIAGDLVLFPSTDHALYAIDRKAGTQRWRFETRGALWAAPVSDGAIAYQAGLDHYLYAYDLALGKLIWEVDLGGPMVGAPTLSADGVLYVGTLNKEILAVQAADGAILWRKPVEGNIWSTPLLHEGKLYFGTDGKKVYLLNAADGQELNKLDAAGSVIAAPVYTEDAVVFASEEGEVFALTLDGESRPWTNTVKGKLYTSPVAVDGQVVVAPYQGEHILLGFSFAGSPDEKWNAVTAK